ncbi:MAG: ATP synthase F1 subunit delta [Anaerolineales bacterium]|nr:ATP synthase F1 subunit delta [Anaerolineales bacterium]MCB9171355.1 ATP synthase F1 subunit delta [Ardenticatenales bacterium]
MSNRSTTTYAEALVQAALGEWLDQLAVVQRNLRRNPDLAAALSDPNRPPTDRASAVGQLVPSNVAPQVARFVQLLARDGELGNLDDVVRHVRTLVPALSDDSSVLVTSAHALSEAEQSKLEEKLRADHGQDIRIAYETDADLLGGLRIRVGDRVIDRSVAAKLEALRQRLVS